MPRADRFAAREIGIRRCGGRFRARVRRARPMRGFGGFLDGPVISGRHDGVACLMRKRRHRGERSRFRRRSGRSVAPSPFRLAANGQSFRRSSSLMSPTARTGGQILVDQLVAQGVERLYCVPGESYLAALDALYDCAGRGHGLPTGGGRRDDGADGGPADGSARHLLRHPRPRSDQRRPRRAYRRTRLRADDPLRRPGRARDVGARRVPGDGLPRLLRLDDQMGDPDRERGADSRGRPARLHIAMQGRPGAGRDRVARGHVGRDGVGRRRASGRGDGDLAGPDADGRAAEDAVDGRAADRASSAARAGPRRPSAAFAALRRAIRSAGRRLVPPRQRASTASTATMPARSASSANPRLKARIEKADLVC